MIGTSLSRCVLDILKKDIDLDSIEKIVTGTAFRTPADLEYVLDKYMKYYWNNDPKAITIVKNLLDSNKIYQPRLDKEWNRPDPDLNPLWVNQESEILWYW